jgi:hypothetical protein
MTAKSRPVGPQDPYGSVFRRGIDAVMGTRVWVALVVLLLAASQVVADPKGDIEAKSKAAMESYDLMDYDAAKKLLNQALAVAKKAKLDKDPAVAKVYLQLGLTAFAAGDPDSASVAFLSAVQIDPKIQIDPAYRSPDVNELLEEARATTGGGEPSSGPGVGGGVDCSGVKGVQHDLLDSAPAGAPATIEARVGSNVSPAKVVVMYRAEGATSFTEAKLTKQGECQYTGAIPAAAMRGSLVHYYVAAYDQSGKLLASKGSSGSPNIIEISGRASVSGDEEDPIGGSSSGGDIRGGIVAGGKPPKVMLSVAGGTGIGYVSGNTEGGNKVETCCVGNSLAVITPELAFFVSPKVAIGLAARIGMPLGANVNAEGADGYSKVAPAGLLRIRYALSSSGEGLRVMAQVGGGVMRNTIKLDTGTPGMDTDIVAQGPILVGAGIGYMKRLGAHFAFVADLSALAGIAVSDKVGTTAVNSGVGADLSIGLAVGF